MRWGKGRACSRAFLGQIMSGVVAAMRRNLLSCTSLARHGLIALATALTALPEPALAGELAVTRAISAWLDLNQQEFAALTASLLFGSRAPRGTLTMATRMLGARDLVLGLGTLRALDRDADAATWAKASAGADAGDAVAAFLVLGAIPTSRALPTAAVAAGALFDTAAAKAGCCLANSSQA